MINIVQHVLLVAIVILYWLQLHANYPLTFEEK